MFRRILFFTLVLFLAAEPAYSQTWLQRYLSERKAKEEAKKAAAAQKENPAPSDGTTEEVRKAEPVNGPSATEPESTVEEPVTQAEPVDPAITPIRRAEPVNPADVSSDATPRVVVATTPDPTPEVQTATTPTPAPARREVTVIAKPSPTPVAPAASPTPDAVDPNTSVVRIAPSNKPLPPDVTQLNYANACYARKEYDRAAAEYERYVNLYPNGADRDAARFRMAESHRQMQNFNAARRGYEALLLDSPEGEFVGPAAYRLADLCFQEKNYPDALAYYRKVSVHVKDPAILLSAKYYTARCLEALKASSEAIEAYQELLTVEDNPFREASRLAVARLLADSGRRTEAIAQFDALIKEPSKPEIKAEATVREGLLYTEMGKGDKAVAALTRALAMPELGSWKEIAEVSLFRALYSSQSYQQVLDTYQASTKQFSAEAQPEVMLIVANSNRQLGKDKAARGLYEQIAHDFADSSYAKEAQYYRLFSLYNANAPELMQEVDAYLAQYPEPSEKRDQLNLLKAESLYKTKKYAAAAPLYAALDSSLLPASLKAEALFKLGWCYTQTQPRDNPAAIQAFSAFVSQYPVHKLAPTALAQRALSYQQTALAQAAGSAQQAQSLKAALADFDSLLSRYPKATKERELAFQQKALILGAKEDGYPAMVNTFERLLEEFPDSPRAGQANYWIGWAAFDAKDYKKAIPALEAARKLDKEHFGDKAARLILQSYYLLEDRAATAVEVDKATAAGAKVSTEILRWLGSEFFKTGDDVHAEKYLAKLTSQDDGAALQPEDWLMLGSARTKLGKWPEAEKALKTYLGKVSEPSQQATGHLALGEAQLAAKQLDEAQKSADSALALQPEGRLNAQGKMLSGDIAMARADFTAAGKLYLSVSVLFSDDSEITPKALAQAYLAYKKAGDAKQAATTLNKLQSLYPEYPVPTVN